MLTFIAVFLSGDSSVLFCSSECKVVLCCASLGCLDFLHFFHLHFPFNSAVLLENSILLYKDTVDTIVVSLGSER